ncbi:MAG TPA: methylmalonyl-CoA epimerase [Flavobacteriales bacterium]|nr:methylmalonyl-CoA epimerase [Flavobacteriales bacterium]|tara:strand:- start:4977 stop:5384 length:408 start_codon:yes stop_codon:yes gene_type:complete
MNKVEHIGIAVKSLKDSEIIFQDILGTESYKMESVTSENVNTLFFQLGETKIELLEATSEDSPIAKFIEKKGEGLHHIAFHVDDIQEKIEELKEKGYRMIHDVPKAGADDKIIAFMHPKSSNGVLVELCADKPKD